MNIPYKRGLFVILGIFSIALSTRIIYLNQIEDQPFFYSPVVDAQTYVDNAKEIAAGSWLGTAPFWQPPFYPYFLATLYALRGDIYYLPRLVQIFLGALTCVLIYGIGCRVFNARVGITAAIAACFYGPFLYFEGELLPVSLATFLNLAMLLVALWRPQGLKWGLVAGLFMGMAAITVPNILLFAPLLIGWSFWQYYKKGGRREKNCGGIKGPSQWSLGLCIAAMVIIFSVTLRNCVVGNDFVLISWNAGINFYIGNHADYERMVGIRPGPGWDELMGWPEEEGIQQYSQRSRFFFSQAWSFIAENPLDYLLLLGRKSYLFWRADEIKRNQDIYFLRAYSPLLHILLWKTPSFAFPFGLLGALAVAGIGQSLPRWRQTLLPLLFTIVYVVSVVLFFISSRYRIPVVPLLLIFGAHALWWGIEQWRGGHYKRLLYSAIPTALLAYFLNAGLPVGNPLGDPEIHFDLGTTYLEQEKFQMAGDAFLRAIELRPEYTRALHNLAVTYAARGLYDQAISRYLQALERDPQAGQIHYNLAQLFVRMKRYKEAIFHFKQVLKVNESSKVYLEIGSIYAQIGELVQALAAYQKALEIVEPEKSAGATRAKAENEMGIIYARQNRFDLAIEHFKRTLVFTPENHEVVFNLAYVYELEGRQKEAMAGYQKVLELNPQYTKARQALARLSANVRNEVKTGKD